jgi:hypothetical protein
MLACRCERYARLLDERITQALRWSQKESIIWLSLLREDGYAEYYDQEFLDRFGLAHLPKSLAIFWPASGPRWDG